MLTCANMASYLGWYLVLIGVQVLFPCVMAVNGKENGDLKTGRFGNDTTHQLVECSWKNSDSLAGVTLYDVQRDTDVYVSVNSKNECKTKTLLGQCAFSDSLVSLKAVILNPPREEFRTFACNATWFEPAPSQGQVLVNISHIDGKYPSGGECASGACSEWPGIATALVVIFAVGALLGWGVVIFHLMRNRKKKQRRRNDNAQGTEENRPLNKRETTEGVSNSRSPSSVSGAPKKPIFKGKSGENSTTTRKDDNTTLDDLRVHDVDSQLSKLGIKQTSDTAPPGRRGVTTPTSSLPPQPVHRY